MYRSPHRSLIYHIEPGRDGTKAFVTGEFAEEGLTDDVKGLSPKEVKSILQWADFYDTDYIYKGMTLFYVGRYPY